MTAVNASNVASGDASACGCSAPTRRPWLHPDVDLREEPTGSVLFDARSERSFRLGRGATRACHLLDGTRTLEIVSAQLRDEGFALEPATFHSLIHRLSDAGLLTTQPAAAPTPRTSTWSISTHGWLWIVRRSQSDRVAARLAARLGRIPRHAVAATVFAGAAWAIAHFDIARFTSSMQSWNLTLADAAVVAVVLAASILAHESAHAVVAKRHGARVLAVGFGLYHLRPCCVCELTGMARLAVRPRVMVAAAGSVVDAVSCLLALLVWQNSGPDGRVAQIALFSGSVIALRLIGNANPLLKLDGYYLVTDLLGRPSLREEAFARLRDQAAYVWRWLARSERPLRWLIAADALTLYGVLAVAASSAMITVSILLLTSWVAQRDATVQRIVALGAAFAIAHAVGNMLRRSGPTGPTPIGKDVIHGSGER